MGPSHLGFLGQLLLVLVDKEEKGGRPLQARRWLFRATCTCVHSAPMMDNGDQNQGLVDLAPTVQNTACQVTPRYNLPAGPEDLEEPSSSSR